MVSLKANISSDVWFCLSYLKICIYRYTCIRCNILFIIIILDEQNLSKRSSGFQLSNQFIQMLIKGTPLFRNAYETVTDSITTTQNQKRFISFYSKRMVGSR